MAEMSHACMSENPSIVFQHPLLIILPFLHILYMYKNMHRKKDIYQDFAAL